MMRNNAETVEEKLERKQEKIKTLKLENARLIVEMSEIKEHEADSLSALQNVIEAYKEQTVELKAQIAKLEARLAAVSASKAESKT
ncbi:hypothetical protein Pelo_5460 [Pelomyxa schiedti]|nr:hypothetical protein Pelo_5460 [Pelomyxa schiedti]